jgi:hypothetical protein
MAESDPNDRYFSLGRTYTIDDVRLQIVAARRIDTNGFLLWNPEGVYSSSALQPYLYRRYSRMQPAARCAKVSSWR